MNIVLFDPIANRVALKPFSDTRPIATIRIGIHTIEEKWKNYIPGTYSHLTEGYLKTKFSYLNTTLNTTENVYINGSVFPNQSPLSTTLNTTLSTTENVYINGSVFPNQSLLSTTLNTTLSTTENLCINGSILPNQVLVDRIMHLQPNEMLVQDHTIIAFWCQQIESLPLDPAGLEQLRNQAKCITFLGAITHLQNKWDLFLHNAQAIKEDFEYIQKSSMTQQIQDPHTIMYNPDQIFVEAGTKIRAAILNAEDGPIYIGKNATIEEQAVIKGPVAISEGAQVRAGSRIYAGTTVGPYAKVGGEIIHSVIFEYSNKAHDGFLGHSVIGEWCNLGANTTASNLRNDYKAVTVWDDLQGDFIQTNLQFCGLFMGAYSKCGIHTMFNTATVVGISTNLFGPGFFKRFIPSFTKGSPRDQLVDYHLEDALMSIESTIARRNKTLTAVDKSILTELYSYKTPTPIGPKTLI